MTEYINKMQPSRFLIVRSEAGIALQITTDLVELCPNVGIWFKREYLKCWALSFLPAASFPLDIYTLQQIVRE